MKKLIVIPVLLFVSLVAQAQPNFRAPRNTRVVLLQEILELYYYNKFQTPYKLKFPGATLLQDP